MLAASSMFNCSRNVFNMLSDSPLLAKYFYVTVVSSFLGTDMFEASSDSRCFVCIELNS